LPTPSRTGRTRRPSCQSRTARMFPASRHWCTNYFACPSSCICFLVHHVTKAQGRTAWQ
jgi:hypothetical protein